MTLEEFRDSIDVQKRDRWLELVAACGISEEVFAEHTAYCVQLDAIFADLDAACVRITLGAGLTRGSMERLADARRSRDMIGMQLITQEHELLMSAI